MYLMENICLFALLLVSVYGPTTTTAAPGPRNPLGTPIGQQCKPGEQTTKVCNSCFCDENGFWVCTQKYCGPFTVTAPPVTVVFICTPHEIKLEDFKICRCEESGTSWNCTPMAQTVCFPQFPITFELNKI